MKNLKQLLIHFAKMCLEKRPNTIVQKDGTTAHSHEYQALVYVAEGIERLIWPTNSLDLDMIEPCWFFIKRKTTLKEPISSKEKLQEA